MNLTSSTWEEETLARIEEARKKQKMHEGEASHWREYADALSKAINLNMQPVSTNRNINRSFDMGKLKGQSVRASLFEIAKARNGIIVVKDVVSILMDAGVFTDRDYARNAIYSNIYHNKKYFEKESPGIYRLNNIQNIMLPLNA